MFERYSERARHIIFLTRLRAGQSGAAVIGTEHLVEALVLEDQGKLADALGVAPGSFRTFATSVSRPSVPFLAPETASAILEKLQEILPHGKAIPDNVDMPTSTALSRAFDAALTLKTELHHKEVEPLHLLAAVLGEEPSQVSDTLRGFGISKEGVITAIKGGEYS